MAVRTSALGGARHARAFKRCETARLRMIHGSHRQLETKLGYTFARPELLRAALAHTSHTHEVHGASPEKVTRLAFLGDAVIELAVRAAVMEELKNEPRGVLSVKADDAVRNSKLAEIAGSTGLDLGPWLELGGSLGEAGREHPRVLADALEAIAGAIYLDCADKTRAIASVGALVQPLLALRPT